MRVLVDDRWVDALLDFHRPAGHYRVEVHRLVNLEPVPGLYFVRGASPRLLWNYLREVGPRAVLRKTRSRMQERLRNDKWLSVGEGRVMEAPDGARLSPGAGVRFAAPAHPRCVERLVLPAELVFPNPGAGSPEAGELAFVPAPRARPGSAPPVLSALAGWFPDSGAPLPVPPGAGLAAEVEAALRRAEGARARRLPLRPRTPVMERSAAPDLPIPSKASDRPPAALFGYGHYAKTVILPHVRSSLALREVHEVDPSQIPLRRPRGLLFDTSPEPRPDTEARVFLIAGYHHTHAPLAARILERGGYAVVEKPVAVDGAQLKDLLGLLEAGRGAGLFACFHRRYSPFNDLALRDLGERPGAPIDYHCIVYEVPLPPHHWYRWPRSRSRLVSNGCHWIDHFVYLNGFAEVEECGVKPFRNGAVECFAVLRNGAVFTMLLTDRGSERIGLQDYVELRSGRTTVRIRDGIWYESETSSRLLRRHRISKTLPYRTMYREIASRIRRGEGGDSVRSVRVSTGLVLALEEKLAAARKAGG